MILFDVGFLLYPFIFCILVFLGVAAVRAHPGYTVAVVFVVAVFWLCCFVVLSVLRVKGWLPCVDVLGNAWGGC